MENYTKKLELNLDEFSSQTKISIVNETNEIDILSSLIDDNDESVRYAVIRRVSFLKSPFSDATRAEKMANLLYKLLKAENKFNALDENLNLVIKTLDDLAELCIRELIYFQAYDSHDIYDLVIPIEFCLTLISKNSITSTATLKNISEAGIKFRFYIIDEIISNRLKED